MTDPSRHASDPGAEHLPGFESVHQFIQALLEDLGGVGLLWTVAELRPFLEHDPEDPLHYAWVLIAGTRMRRSEVLGLRWVDVDFAASRLAVRQHLASVDGNPELSETKSNRSGRVIDPDERTVSALRVRRAQQAEHRLACGAAWHDLDLVVAREDGLRIHPDWSSELFRRGVAAAGLRPIRLHLRHPHATLLHMRECIRRSCRSASGIAPSRSLSTRTPTLCRACRPPPSGSSPTSSTPLTTPPRSRSPAAEAV